MKVDTNFNPIDMVMEVKHFAFINAVEYLNEIVCRRNKIKKMLANTELGSVPNLFESI